MNFLKKATVTALVLSFLVAFAVSFGSMRNEGLSEPSVPVVTEDAAATETERTQAQTVTEPDDTTEEAAEDTAEDSTVSDVQPADTGVTEVISSGTYRGGTLSEEGEQAVEADTTADTEDSGMTADHEADPGRGDDADFSDFSELEDGDTDETPASHEETRVDGFEYFTRVYRTDEGRLFKVPLSYELQKYTYDMCVKYNVPYRIIMGLFGNETSWNANIGIVNGYVGLGMLNVEYNASYFAKRGIDIYTAKGNIEAVCYTMSDKLRTFGGNISYALMAYNLGTAGAKTAIANGTTSTSYSRRIISLAENLLTDEQYGEMKKAQ